MKKLIMCILSLISFVSFWSCHSDPDNVDIVFYNNTNDTIYVASAKSWEHLYDTLTLNVILNEPDITDTKGFVKIAPKQACNRINYIYLRPRADEKYCSTKFQIVVMKRETLERYSREYLIDNDLVDYRVFFTYDEIIGMGYKIVFTNE